MPKQLTQEQLAKLLASSPGTPTKSRPWACCSIASTERLQVYGWFRNEWHAKQVAVHLFINAPVIGRHYPSGTLSRTRFML